MLQEGEYYDTIHLDVVDGDSYTSCQTGQAHNGGLIVNAWTQEMDVEDPEGDLEEVTVIKICPWYLAEELASFHTQSPVYITQDLVAAAYQLSINPPDHPPANPDIEAFALVDQTILHEVRITGYILHQRRQIMILRLLY